VKKRVWAAICASEVLAPESTATVAPFRAWRGSQSIAAKVPTQITNTLYVCHKPWGLSPLCCYQLVLFL